MSIQGWDMAAESPHDPGLWQDGTIRVEMEVTADESGNCYALHYVIRPLLFEEVAMGTDRYIEHLAGLMIDHLYRGSRPSDIYGGRWRIEVRRRIQPHLPAAPGFWLSKTYRGRLKEPSSKLETAATAGAEILELVTELRAIEVVVP